MDFLRDALTVPESLLCVARKNAKSAIIAVYLLGRLVGPLRYHGYRAGVCSINREKAGELWMQMDAIVEASGLKGVRCMKSPKHVISDWGRVDILSADAGAGHSSGFDDVFLDELGLLKERDRELVNGLRTSVSARNGRFIGLSIQGNAPFTHEMLERRGRPDLVVHHYAGPDNCKLGDESAWAAANPGLAAGIKSIEYMRHQAARALATPGDAPGVSRLRLEPASGPGQGNCSLQRRTGQPVKWSNYRNPWGRWSWALTCPVVTRCRRRPRTGQRLGDFRGYVRFLPSRRCGPGATMTAWGSYTRRWLVGPN